MVPSIERPDVAIVVLTYRSPAGLLERAVDSISAGGHAPIVVDNGDGAAARLAGRCVDVVPAETNGGYGAGMNLGLRTAFDRGATHVALLNDDVEVEPGWLDATLAGFDGDRVGAVQPLLVNPTGERVNSAGVTVDPAGQGHDTGRGEPAAAFGDDPLPIEVFTGGAVVLRREFVDDVGGFDERFFLYYEDVELSRRGARAGWQYRLAPSARVRHVGGSTTAPLGDDVRRLQERNRLWSSFLEGGSAEVGRGIWLSIRRLRHAPRRAHARALAGGLAGAPQRLFERWSARR